ncbi:MAG: DegT/DnrJ/EryC1/StrS aminotransferase family protein [Candidatus Woesebacteria bacterium GW2011_GWB1_43_14]|uniref:DegT/DnrJ/EryC1/StrS aminotransferase family protein n=1 Tax=Candidatus Woesebacteria bacterium GW2011_GWB1_43_14 TaxID=1618578 RepID=A0A0G1FRR6_9BACT|nr:MAG: DegT/DnrJ/EryC1/StrS aminotransferase family protein [Candidatus Woesebacteria bacterium GW2011_GWB1_43_14]
MVSKNIPQMEPWFDEKEARAVYKYMKLGGWVMEFKKTTELEQMICEFTGARYCSMMPNGTISLTLALLALGLKADDEVLVPDLTMIASPNAAEMIGIKSVSVDIEPQNLCMDLKAAQKAITKKTKALMYVAFNGRSADMSQVVTFCKRHKLFLVEDAAQALGSFWKVKHLGTLGEIGSFSFSVPKIISTGQGGALVTNKKSLHKKIQQLKNFGRAASGGDIHPYWGWNFRFTDIQAVIGIEQMKKLKARTKRKKQIYKRYHDNLKGIEQIKFVQTDLEQTTPWFIDIYVPKSKRLAHYLSEKGIGTRPLYPPIHTQKIYQNRYSSKNFPITRHYSQHGLWLPSSSKLKNEEIDYICKSIKNYFT